MRLIVIVAVQHDVSAERSNGIYLDRGRGEWHDNRRRNTTSLRRKRDALSMVACRAAYDTGPDRFCRQCRKFVVCAPQLERENGLQVLAFHEHAITQPFGQIGRQLQWRFAGYVVNCSFVDQPDVVVNCHETTKSIVSTRGQRRF